MSRGKRVERPREGISLSVLPGNPNTSYLHAEGLAVGAEPPLGVCATNTVPGGCPDLKNVS